MLFFKAQGKVNVNIKELGIDADLNALTQPGTPASELAPKLTVQNFDIQLDPNNVDI